MNLFALRHKNAQKKHPMMKKETSILERVSMIEEEEEEEEEEVKEGKAKNAGFVNLMLMLMLRTIFIALSGS